MSLHNVQHDAETGHQFLRARWMDIRAAFLRWFDRERELVNLRVVVGMLSEARQRDAKEHQSMFDGSRRAVELSRLYEELIYAVQRKWPGETRHQTALRYIQQAEVQPMSTAKTAAMEPK